jgi:hypothetical protein
MPFTVHVPDDLLADLRRRVADTRFPPPSPAEPWSDGTAEAFLRDLLAYWRDGFGLREQERRINALPQFQTVADGRGPHFVHARSSRPDALPLLLIHGTPSDRAVADRPRCAWR